MEKMTEKEYLKKIINEELSINEQVAVKSRELLYQIEDSIYINASKNLLNDNEALKHVSNVLYYSYSFEQDGYVNGLYADLMTNTSIILSWDNIKDSSAYTGYAMLSKSLEIISKNKDKKSVIDSCNMYNITVNELLKNGYTAKERFIRKIGNVIIKARKDKQLNENINITTGKHGEITWFED